MEINYFSDCTNEELQKLWDYRYNFSSMSQDNPIHPYLEKYCATQSKIPMVICELDFYKECARRFFENDS